MAKGETGTKGKFFVLKEGAFGRVGNNSTDRGEKWTFFVELRKKTKRKSSAAQ